MNDDATTSDRPAGAGGDDVGAVPASRPDELPPRSRTAHERQRLATVARSDLEAYKYALWRRRVTFHDVASAWFHMSDPDLPAADRARFRAVFPGLLDAFAEPRGGIITAYFCRNIRVAAALTAIDRAASTGEGVPELPRDRLPGRVALEAIGADPVFLDPSPALDTDAGVGANGHADAVADSNGGEPGRRRWWLGASAPKEAPVTTDGDGASRRGSHARAALRPFEAPQASSSAIHIEPTFGDPADWPAKALLFECMRLQYRALEFLTPQPRKICMRMIFGVITALLGTLDARHAPGAQSRPFPSHPAELATLERELERAQAYYDASCRRQAQLEYFVGMLVSAMVLVGAFAVLAVTDDVLERPLLTCLFAGALGAVVSVMTRMTSGSLELEPEAGRRAIRFVGAFRPVIGAVFGAAIYVLIAGGLLSFAEPDGVDPTLYYAGLAFLAGFTERLASDAIAGASSSLGLSPSGASAARP